MWTPFRSGDPLTRPHGPGLTDTGRVIGCATAVFFLGAGVIHVSAAADHENLPVMMAGFLLVATLQAAFGALLLWRRPGRLLLAAGLALMGGSIGLWLISRTAGLPFLPGGHMEPIGFKDGVTVVFELASIPGLLLLASRDLQRVVLPSPRLGERAIAGVGAAVFVLFVPALLLGGGEHHSAAELAAMGGHAHGDGDEHGDEPASVAGAEDHGHGGEAASGGRSGHGDHATADSSATDGHELADVGDGGGSDHAGSGHGDAVDEPAGGHEPGRNSPHTGEEEHAPAPGGGHGGGDTGEGSHPESGQPAEDHGGDPGDHGGGEDGGEGGGMPGPDDPGGMYWGAHSLDYEPARARGEGDPGRGPAFVYRGPPDPSQGIGHHSDAPCQPTPEEESAADRLYRQTAAVLTRYDNAPQLAIADGFTYIFPLTDRIIHMVHPARVSDPTILDAGEIESFLYAMTDRGLMPIAGMYVMPEADMPGPRIGGCRTQWHEHAGLSGLAVSAGTMNETPEMLHVWTYPGLDPYGHYDGRSTSQLWAPWSFLPSACRQAGDNADACLP